MTTHKIPLYSPQSEWFAPEVLPDLRLRKTIAVDCETRDPDIKTKGPGWATNNGELVGVAIAVEGFSMYLPINHKGGGNLDPKIVKKWLIENLSNEENTKVFHNASYDIGWLRNFGVDVKGRIVDTMIAAPLINENEWTYSLNNLSRIYLKDHKEEKLLEQAAREWGVDPKGERWKLPAPVVGPYAEKDAELTLRLWNILEVELLKQNVVSIFNTETELLPLLINMKWKGVRVDLDQAQIYKKKLISEEQKLLQEIKKETGIELEMWASRNIQKIFDKLKIKYGTTEKGNPSFTKIFLQNHQHPIPKKIVKAREINKAHTTFIDTILDHSVNSRIHADIHQLRDGESGTVTGRFSMSNPNLQQIPARDAYIGPMIRSLFLPEVGQKWGSFDYSQQEPRLVVHYASLTKLEGADKVLEAYKTDPNADFHTMMADMANIDRKIAKVVNLGLFYGMGINKLANELGVDKEEAKALYERYNNKVPFVKQLAEACSYKAATEGFIRTLLGRLCRFDKWEPVAYGVHTALPRKEAEREYGNYLKRAMTFKALNRLIQGSAADQIKKSMVDLGKLGYIPLIQIHDELAISVNNDDIPVIKKTMEESVPSMIVPSKVDVSIGNNWGESMG